ncbi:MAG TPA: hypothetical protein VLZ74_03660 [Methylocella sp.]|nr:hypothetical protein [Methylocella sp.]
MGVDVYILNFLAHCRHQYGPFGRTFLLGRQGIHVWPDNRPSADEIVRKHGIGQSLAEASGRQYYAEKLLRSFGATEVVSGDASAYEGATFVHDFNNPLPEEIKDQYDTVFDGGSLEHIFNVPIALTNLMKLTRVGGHLLTVNAANNMLGHGFYQFSPDLFFRVFSTENGFETLTHCFADQSGRPNLREAIDPGMVRKRVELSSTEYCTYLMFAARKTREVEPFRFWPQQSDYQLAWGGDRIWRFLRDTSRRYPTLTQYIRGALGRVR